MGKHQVGMVDRLVQEVAGLPLDAVDRADCSSRRRITVDAYDRKVKSPVFGVAV
jgi:hypothetical protein